MQRHLKVGEGNNRFDVVLQQFIEHVIVEFQPFFIRLAFVAQREDARPGDRGAEALEAHLGEQLDVFFVAAVEIDGFVVRIVLARLYLLGYLARHAVRAAGKHVADARAFAVFIPAAFNLVRGDGATP